MGTGAAAAAGAGERLRAAVEDEAEPAETGGGDNGGTLTTLAVTRGESVAEADADDVEPRGFGAIGAAALFSAAAALAPFAFELSPTRGVPAPSRWIELELALLDTASPPVAPAAAAVRASCRNSPSSSSELIDALSSIESSASPSASESSGGGSVGGGGGTGAGGAGGASADIELLVDGRGGRALIGATAAGTAAMRSVSRWCCWCDWWWDEWLLDELTAAPPSFSGWCRLIGISMFDCSSWYTRSAFCTASCRISAGESELELRGKSRHGMAPLIRRSQDSLESASA